MLINGSITLIRHSRTTNSTADADRRVTPEGEELARKRRELLGNPTFDLVLHSPAVRARQTACLVAGLSPNAETVVVPELWPLDEDPRMVDVTKAYRGIGNAALRGFYTNRWVARSIMSLGHDANKAIQSKTTEKSCVLVVGHAVLIPQICMLAVPPRLSREFFGRPVAECEGWSMIFRDGKIEVFYAL